MAREKKKKKVQAASSDWATFSWRRGEIRTGKDPARGEAGVRRRRRGEGGRGG